LLRRLYHAALLTTRCRHPYNKKSAFASVPMIIIVSRCAKTEFYLVKKMIALYYML
jgi:hypothetical protein